MSSWFAPASESTRCTNLVEPTGTVDLLTTTVPGRSTGAISRATASTNDRSAAPSAPCGVCTQRNTMSASRAAACRAGDEPQPVRGQPGADQLGQTLLEDRHLALVQAGDAFLVDVGADDVVTEVREARGGGESDVPRADDCDVHGRNVRWRLLSSPRPAVSGRRRGSRRVRRRDVGVVRSRPEPSSPVPSPGRSPGRARSRRSRPRAPCRP